MIVYLGTTSYWKGKNLKLVEFYKEFNLYPK